MTKEHFDEKISQLASKDELKDGLASLRAEMVAKTEWKVELTQLRAEMVTKDELKTALNNLSEGLKAYSREQTEELARVISRSFIDQQEYLVQMIISAKGRF